tara:strand:+ start:5329 stop:5889 length:561 start_codon:yes stop_codon:yes gene_type:complete
MKNLLILLFSLIIFEKCIAQISHENYEKIFNIGKMESYNKEFTLYFKPRKKSILVRGEENNYIRDFPQDLYIYNHKTKKDLPLISYEWFSKEAKKITNYYLYPVFPEDFAYYLLEDNNTLVMINAKKKFRNNFEFNIKKKELSIHKNKGKIDFIISTFAKNCGFKSMEHNYNCYFYKPLISNYLLN